MIIYRQWKETFESYGNVYGIDCGDGLMVSQVLLIRKHKSLHCIH